MIGKGVFGKRLENWESLRAINRAIRKSKLAA